MEAAGSKDCISHIWTRWNPRWLVTGLIAGIGAGLVMLVVAAILDPREFTYPAKLIGASLFGANAMDVNSFNIGGFAGLVIHFGLAGFFGLVFAQFIHEETRKRILIILGALAGIAVWLFWSMMFMPSFNEPMLWLMPKTISLLLHAIFGITFGLLIVALRPRICK